MKEFPQKQRCQQQQQDQTYCKFLVSKLYVGKNGILHDKFNVACLDCYDTKFNTKLPFNLLDSLLMAQLVGLKCKNKQGSMILII